MRGYRDSTANIAVGQTMHELKYMAALAVRIRESSADPTWKEDQSKKFTGIYARLLTDPIDYVKNLAEKHGRYSYK